MKLKTVIVMRFGEKMARMAVALVVVIGLWGMGITQVLTPMPVHAQGQPLPGQSVGSGHGRAVLILDGSGSMWGQMDGDHKVVQVRKALAQAVRKFAQQKHVNGRFELGLAAFGHRKAIGCTDIGLLLPPQPLEPAIISNVANKVSPRGSGPLASTLSTIAEAARLADRPGDLILLADGPDNCRKDPCAAAAALKKKAPRTRVHVIGLGASRARLKPLACIAQNTGGLFLTATTKAELGEALLLSFYAATQSERELAALHRALKQPQRQASHRGGQSVAGGTAAKQTTIAADLQAEASGEASSAPLKLKQRAAHNLEKGQGLITLSAALVDGGKTIKSGLVWRVFAMPASGRGKVKMLAKAKQAQAQFILPAGSYMVNAAYGRAYLTQKLDVKERQETQARFILNAGGLRLWGIAPDGRAARQPLVRFSVYSDDRDQFGRRRLIVANIRPGVILRLNSGIYHIVSQYGDVNARVSADVTVEAGKLTEATVNHTAAQVKLKLVRVPGGEALPGTQWQLMDHSGRLIKRSTGALPTHYLAAGEYRVVARHSGKTYQAKFSVKPKDVTQIEVIAQSLAE